MLVCKPETCVSTSKPVCRLDLSYSFWLDDFDHRLLHQKISVANGNELKLADVGTGKVVSPFIE